MHTEIQNIIALLNSTFEKNAWHGPSIKETLAGISREQAISRVGISHTIVELVAHMTTWRIFTRNKLQGLNYEVTDELNFPKTNDWEKVLSDLKESQTSLLKCLEEFPASRLHDVVPHGSYSYTYYTLLHGIIHHDLYHVGQIAFIKKAK